MPQQTATLDASRRVHYTTAALQQPVQVHNAAAGSASGVLRGRRQPLSPSRQHPPVPQAAARKKALTSSCQPLQVKQGQVENLGQHSAATGARALQEGPPVLGHNCATQLFDEQAIARAATTPEAGIHSVQARTHRPRSCRGGQWSAVGRGESRER